MANKLCEYTLLVQFDLIDCTCSTCLHIMLHIKLDLTCQHTFLISLATYLNVQNLDKLPVSCFWEIIELYWNSSMRTCDLFICCYYYLHDFSCFANARPINKIRFYQETYIKWGQVLSLPGSMLWVWNNYLPSTESLIYIYFQKLYMLNCNKLMHPLHGLQICTGRPYSFGCHKIWSDMSSRSIADLQLR